MVSLHTSPLDQPGTGDAGGMNVYVSALSRELAARGVAVDIFTRATSARLPETVQAWPGVWVRHVPAGPYEGLAKDDLPAALCSFARGLLRYEAAAPPGRYDLVHAHYWLSGQVGVLAAERWGVPLVASMHTLAKVKNAALADGERPEPPARLLGEQQVIDDANRLVANTDAEARQLIELYDAEPDRVDVVEPGVDLQTFQPATTAQRLAARRAAGIDEHARVVLFVGRFQPHKAPDLLVRALAAATRAGQLPADAPVTAVFVGGPSGSSSLSADDLHGLAVDLGVGGRVQTQPPAQAEQLAHWYQLADLTVVPSHSESFGLVAVEAQACGTPVLAAAVGGLPVAVDDGVSGELIDGHDPDEWGRRLGQLLAEPRRLARLRTGAVRHARKFGWERTAERTLQVYAAAADDLRMARAG
jgi:D-inositol-3-phosphate glycosyltransferase